MVEEEVVVVVVMVVHEAAMVDTREDMEGHLEATAAEAMVTKPVVAMEAVIGQAEGEVEGTVEEVDMAAEADMEAAMAVAVWVDMEQAMVVEDMVAVSAGMEVQELRTVLDMVVPFLALVSPPTLAAWVAHMKQATTVHLPTAAMVEGHTEGAEEATVVLEVVLVDMVEDLLVEVGGVMVEVAVVEAMVVDLPMEEVGVVAVGGIIHMAVDDLRLIAF